METKSISGQTTGHDFKYRVFIFLWFINHDSSSCVNLLQTLIESVLYNKLYVNLNIFLSDLNFFQVSKNFQTLKSVKT